MKELDNLKALGIENPYVYLQIKESATDVEIKRAFRELAKRYAYDENRQCDGHYLRQIFVTCYEALQNKEARAVIDENLQRERRENAIQIREKEERKSQKQATQRNVTTSVETILKSTNGRVQKQAREEVLLPEILGEFSISEGDLSFVEIQLILKEYLKRSWDSYESQSTVSGYEKIEETYLLLDKKGHLRSVRDYYQLSFLSDNARRLLDTFTSQRIHSIEDCDYDTAVVQEALTLWHDVLPEDECLVTTRSIFPEKIVNSYRLNSKDIAKGLELGNECLLRMRKDGYLKKPSGKEYIR